MSDELDVLKSVTAQLEGAGIAYMVTGSMAANFYTVPRMTRDIDLVIELSERDGDRPACFNRNTMSIVTWSNEPSETMPCST